MFLKVKFLAKSLSSSFSRLHEREWQLLTTNSVELKVKKEELVLDESEDNMHLYKVMSGTLRVEVKLATGKIVTINTLKEGAIFGEMSLIGTLETKAKIIADSNVKLRKIEASFILGILNMDPQLAIKFWKSLASILYHRLRTLPSAYKIAGDIKNEGITRFNDGSPSKVPTVIAMSYYVEGYKISY